MESEAIKYVRYFLEKFCKNISRIGDVDLRDTGRFDIHAREERIANCEIY